MFTNKKMKIRRCWGWVVIFFFGRHRTFCVRGWKTGWVNLNLSQAIQAHSTVNTTTVRRIHTVHIYAPLTEHFCDSIFWDECRYGFILFYKKEKEKYDEIRVVVPHSQFNGLIASLSVNWMFFFWSAVLTRQQREWIEKNVLSWYGILLRCRLRSCKWWKGKIMMSIQCASNIDDNTTDLDPDPDWCIRKRRKNIRQTETFQLWLSSSEFNYNFFGTFCLFRWAEVSAKLCSSEPFDVQ